MFWCHLNKVPDVSCASVVMVGVPFGDNAGKYSGGQGQISWQLQKSLLRASITWCNATRKLPKPPGSVAVWISENFVR